MEFDEGKLEFVPEEEKRKFLLKGECNKEDNRHMNINEFLERRKKETPEETKKYEKEAERIMSMEDNDNNIAPKAKRGRSARAMKLAKIRQKDPYAAQRIANIIFERNRRENI